MSPELCDVLVIGGGPAGATAAALLAARGRDVVLLEKQAHPRFQIGESLLPRNLAIFERLGVSAAVDAIGVCKRGAEFVSDTTGQSVAFPFSVSVRRGPAHAYQVQRAAFDKILFDNAVAKGARGFERTRALAVEPGPYGRQVVRAHGDAAWAEHRFLPRYILDASGRDGFLAHALGNRQSDKRHNSASVFAHYRGAEARTGAREGYISVHLAEDGWFWLIPLPDGVMSVGFVGAATAFKGRAGPLATLLDERIAASPTVGARMHGATRVSDVMGAANYGYQARRSWTENSCMIGDAFAFTDPVFSSGVLLAMTAGELGANAADAWLDDPVRGNAIARRNERALRASMARIAWLIARINTPALRAMFMSPSNALGMRDGLVSLLAGNLARDIRTLPSVLAFKAAYYALSLRRQ